MDAKSALKINMDMGQYIALGYLEDMTDAEMMHRPAPGANHIKWQMGHLITSEHDMLERCFPGSMPALPTGFAERYTKESAHSDADADFDSKEALLAAYHEQRAGTEKKLAELSAEDLDRTSHESMADYAPTVGAAFSMQGTHWVMHAGQWAVIRRQLGRKPMF